MESGSQTPKSNVDLPELICIWCGTRATVPPHSTQQHPSAVVQRRVNGACRHIVKATTLDAPQNLRVRLRLGLYFTTAYTVYIL